QIYDPVTRGWRNRSSVRAEDGTFDMSVRKWTWSDVLEVLMGREPKPKAPSDTSTKVKKEESFKPFFDLLKELGLVKEEADLKSVIEASGFENSEVGAVRHAVKAHFRPDVIKKLAAVPEATLKAQPWGKDPAYDWSNPETVHAARHRYADQELGKLDNSDKGNLMEDFIQATERPNATQHVHMSKADLGKYGIDPRGKESRKVDLADKGEPGKSAPVSEEIKSGEIGPDDVKQVSVNADVVAKKMPIGKDAVTPEQTFLRMTSAKAAKSAREDLIDLLSTYQKELTVIVYNNKGFSRTVTYDGRPATAGGPKTESIDFLRNQKAFEDWLALE
ncbi:MAG TPA: hypothetical protein VL172_05565, partial [Kofleriaceae bacterium]|nr:hypothetical protein [Kofleriaceae bacterium]